MILSRPFKALQLERWLLPPQCEEHVVHNEKRNTLNIISQTCRVVHDFRPWAGGLLIRISLLRNGAHNCGTHFLTRPQDTQRFFLLCGLRERAGVGARHLPGDLQGVCAGGVRGDVRGDVPGVCANDPPIWANVFFFSCPPPSPPLLSAVGGLKVCGHPEAISHLSSLRCPGRVPILRRAVHCWAIGCGNLFPPMFDPTIWSSLPFETAPTSVQQVFNFHPLASGWNLATFWIGFGSVLECKKRTRSGVKHRRKQLLS